MYSAVFKVKVFPFAKSCLFCCFYGYFIVIAICRIEKMTSFFLMFCFSVWENLFKQRVMQVRKALIHKEMKEDYYIIGDLKKMISVLSISSDSCH